jgi:hypothetical protein
VSGQANSGEITKESGCGSNVLGLSLENPDLTETEFREYARKALEALEELKGICGCPN